MGEMEVVMIVILDVELEENKELMAVVLLTKVMS